MNKDNGLPGQVLQQPLFTGKQNTICNLWRSRTQFKYRKQLHEMKNVISKLETYSNTEKFNEASTVIE